MKYNFDHYTTDNSDTLKTAHIKMTDKEWEQFVNICNFDDEYDFSDHEIDCDIHYYMDVLGDWYGGLFMSLGHAEREFEPYVLHDNINNYDWDGDYITKQMLEKKYDTLADIKKDNLYKTIYIRLMGV